MGLQRVGHDRVTELKRIILIHSTLCGEAFEQRKAKNVLLTKLYVKVVIRIGNAAFLSNIIHGHTDSHK